MRKTIKKMNEEFDRVFQDKNDVYLEKQLPENGLFQKKSSSNTKLKCLTFSICTNILVCLITGVLASWIAIKCVQNHYPTTPSITEKSIQHGKKYFEENKINDLNFNCSILFSSTKYVLNTYQNNNYYYFQIYTHSTNELTFRMNKDYIDYTSFEIFSYFWDCEKDGQKEFHIEILQENNLLDEVTFSF